MNGFPGTVPRRLGRHETVVGRPVLKAVKWLLILGLIALVATVVSGVLTGRRRVR